MASQPHIGIEGEALRVRGLVQGVGFRPSVWRLAGACGLDGDICNDAAGVLIRVWGNAQARERFRERLCRDAPPLARIDSLESTPVAAAPSRRGFHILESRAGEARTGVVADAATCDDCLAEIRDRAARRHGYAFTNCTHCGPRFSIVSAIPYDRANTTMRPFALCASCRAEYDDPADRRFHAQPIACPDCGPRLWLERPAGTEVPDDAIAAAVALIREGGIVAVRGIGGIHLACDATNAIAVARLRRRKHRHEKPFALLARDLPMIRRHSLVGDTEARLLGSPAAPIVLLAARGETGIAAGVAPGQRTLGFMLPYSPLHHLLMAGLDVPIVLTSGNRSEEPQCTDNAEARDRLAEIADAWLLHDRDIDSRIDDSVVRVIGESPTLLRRARGYAPAPLALPDGFAGSPAVVAMGGELKNTFCLARRGEAILSQHLGDLENARAYAAFGDTLERFLDFYAHRPAAIAVDAHPDYLPSKFGRERAARDGLRLIEVQHHHAHVAACLADNGVEPGEAPVLGLAFDGLGFGDDGTIWGGEFLLAGYAGYRRLACLRPVAMPGAAQAIREPWRMAYAWLGACGLLPAWPPEHPAMRFLDGIDRRLTATIAGMLDAGFNSPLTSSCGRLFDAVAAVLGLRGSVSYEGQAAIELEAIVEREALDDGGYAFDIREQDGFVTLDPAPMWAALGRDIARGVPRGVIAARFHAGLAAALAATVAKLEALHGNAWQGRVALSGGVFQNAVLTALAVDALEARGLEVLRHRQVPPNDGGLSLGQAAVASARLEGDA